MASNDHLQRTDARKDDDKLSPRQSAGEGNAANPSTTDASPTRDTVIPDVVSEPLPALGQTPLHRSWGVSSSSRVATRGRGARGHIRGRGGRGNTPQGFGGNSTTRGFGPGSQNAASGFGNSSTPQSFGDYTASRGFSGHKTPQGFGGLNNVSASGSNDVPKSFSNSKAFPGPGSNSTPQEFSGVISVAGLDKRGRITCTYRASNSGNNTNDTSNNTGQGFGSNNPPQGFDGINKILGFSASKNFLAFRVETSTTTGTSISNNADDISGPHLELDIGGGRIGNITGVSPGGGLFVTTYSRTLESGGAQIMDARYVLHPVPDRSKLIAQRLNLRRRYAHTDDEVHEVEQRVSKAARKDRDSGPGEVAELTEEVRVLKQELAVKNAQLKEMERK
ncbi:hypothetical protein ACLX1H_003217 [Fusarium chlamydosporum]